MTKASAGTLRSAMGEDNQSIEMNIGQDIADDLIDPDLFLRTFGISDDYVSCDHFKDTNVFDTIGQMSVGAMETRVEAAGTNMPGVIIKNSQSSSGSLGMVASSAAMAGQAGMLPNTFARQRNASSVTLEQRTQENVASGPGEQLVSIPMSTLHNILYQQQQQQQQHQQVLDQSEQMTGAVKSQRKRTQHQMKCPENRNSFNASPLFQPVFTVPSPVAISPVYVDQKIVPMNTCDDQIMMSAPVSRPSPQSTPPPPLMTESGEPRKYKSRSGRATPTGKRSRPQTPTSDSESDGGWRDREPLGWASGRTTPVEVKPAVRLEDLVDEDKYNKRKRSTSGGDGQTRGKGKDPMKAMLEQLQQVIPHIGNPDEEKVSHAGLLVEGSDYIRSLKRENNTTSGNVEHLKLKIDQLHAEIEAFQEQLPEHGSSSIHRIVSKRGKSIPDMFADHVRQKTQSDWKYWVYTSIMGHFVHSFAQEVSNISPEEMERTSTEWVQEKMSMTSLRKDAFRKLAKLCAKTSIMEDPSKLPEEARGFVALSESDLQQSETEAQKISKNDFE